MTKVLAAIVVPPHLSVSGAARAAERLSAELARSCEVTVASMLSDEVLETAPFRRIRVHSSLPRAIPWDRLSNRYRTLFYRSNLPDLISRESYDLVHLHNPMPALELERVAKACIASGVPYVISTHGFNEIANGVRVYQFGLAKSLVWQQFAVSPLSRVLKRASGVFALSPADIEIVRRLGFSGQELSIVPNGVEKAAPGDPRADGEALGRLGIPPRRDGQVTLAFLANHTPNKGLPVLLEAFTRISQPCLLIVGGETRNEVNYDKARLAAGPGREVVVTGRLSDAEVAAIFRRSDMFVFPTLADTFPLVVLEAMSYGLPVIASRVGGIPYQIDKGCGVLVEPGHVEELAAAIDRLAQSPLQRLAMARQAIARVSEDFTWEHAANRAVAGYHRILAQNHLVDIRGDRSPRVAFPNNSIR